MGLEVTSNIQALVSRLQQRGQGLRDYIIVLSNHTKYAAAVDQGSTRIIVWSKLSRAQRFAIIKAMQKRAKQNKKQGKKWLVTRGGEKGQKWTKIIIPPAGIMIRSRIPIKKHIEDVLSRLPVGQQAAEEIARGMESILIGNTPVDEGVLASGWKVQVL